MQGIKQFLINAAQDFRTYLALGSLIFAYIAFRRHKRKRLVYEILSNAALFSVRREIREKVKIFYEDKPVEKVNLVVIRFINAGNDAILTKDFDLPISINFGDEAAIISAEISEKTPQDLPAEISYTGTVIKLEPLLLNEKDSITIKALVSKASDMPAISARIAGVKALTDRTEKIDLTSVKFISFVFIVTAGATLLGNYLDIKFSDAFDTISLLVGVASAVYLYLAKAISARLERSHTLK